mmetsp:Transcript_11664/g.31329  ORF Transcript_11664/g.31329 Transcript_11664/m.31329 type:complete len:498 (-) Transcript_11664:97-1590(-)
MDTNKALLLTGLIAQVACTNFGFGEALNSAAAPAEAVLISAPVAPVSYGQVDVERQMQYTRHPEVSQGLGGGIAEVHEQSRRIGPVPLLSRDISLIGLDAVLDERLPSATVLGTEGVITTGATSFSMASPSDVRSPQQVALRESSPMAPADFLGMRGAALHGLQQPTPEETGGQFRYSSRPRQQQAQMRSVPGGDDTFVALAKEASQLREENALLNQEEAWRKEENTRLRQESDQLHKDNEALRRDFAKLRRSSSPGGEGLRLLELMEERVRGDVQQRDPFAPSTLPDVRGKLALAEMASNTIETTSSEPATASTTRGPDTWSDRPDRVPIWRDAVAQRDQQAQAGENASGQPENRPEYEFAPSEHPLFEMRSKVALAFIEAFGMGFCGVDRCYMGQARLGILKGMSLGGFIIWAAIDYSAILYNSLMRKKSINRFGLKATFMKEDEDTSGFDDIDMAFVVMLSGVLIVCGVEFSFLRAKLWRYVQRRQAREPPDPP